MKILKTLPVSLLIMLFVYAPVSKLLSPEDFHGQLYNQPFPHFFAGLLFYLLPVSELATVIFLLSDHLRLAGLWMATVLMCAFTLYIGTVLLHWWPRVPCSCGGVLNGMSWEVHFIFNLFFLAISLYALLAYYRNRRQADWPCYEAS